MENIEQRTSEWFAARCGTITASRFRDAIDVPEDAGQPYKSGARKGQLKPASSEARNTYMRELAFERRSGRAIHEISSRSLAWGEEVEVYGKEAFELETGLVLEPGGFYTHPDYPFIGASPDAIIPGMGGYEAKSPYSEAIHVRTLLDGMPSDHKDQVQGGMLVTGLPTWFFVSFDPRQHPDDQLHIQVIQRDDDYINRILLPGLLQFEMELQALVRKLEQRAIEVTA